MLTLYSSQKEWLSGNVVPAATQREKAERQHCPEPSPAHCSLHGNEHSSQALGRTFTLLLSLPLTATTGHLLKLI